MPIIPSINDVKRSRRLEDDNARIPRDMRKLAGSIVIDRRSVLEKSIEFSVNSFSPLILPLENALADIPELSAKESFASNGSIHEFAVGGTYQVLEVLLQQNIKLHILAGDHLHRLLGGVIL